MATKSTSNRDAGCLGLGEAPTPTTPSGATAAACAPIVDHLSERYTALKIACWELLNNIKARAPKEDRQLWRCPDFQRISNLIKFE